MTVDEFLDYVVFPIFFLSSIVWLGCIVFFRSQIPQAALVKAPLILARRGGVFGWVGALSSGGLILSFLLLAALELVRVWHI